MVDDESLDAVLEAPFEGMGRDELAPDHSVVDEQGRALTGWSTALCHWAPQPCLENDRTRSPEAFGAWAVLPQRRGAMKETSSLVAEGRGAQNTPGCLDGDP